MTLENVVEGREYNHVGLSKLCIYARFLCPSHHFTSRGKYKTAKDRGQQKNLRIVFSTKAWLFQSYRVIHND